MILRQSKTSRYKEIIVDKLIGRLFRTDIACDLVNEKDWKVTVSIIERRLLEGKEWEEKEV